MSKRLKARKFLIPGPIREWIRTSFVYRLCDSEQEAVLFLLRTALKDSPSMNRKAAETVELLNAKQSPQGEPK